VASYFSGSRRASVSGVQFWLASRSLFLINAPVNETLNIRTLC
jgi:hypothetical protein